MFLIDTNIWLELLLEQEKAQEVHKFFKSVDSHLLAITEFSLYSIGVILTRLKKHFVFEDFLLDTLEESDVMRVCLAPPDLKQVMKISLEYQLDFDDSYQYVAVEKYNLEIISFDTDFDRTTKGRKEPGDIK